MKNIEYKCIPIEFFSYDYDEASKVMELLEDNDHKLFESVQKTLAQSIQNSV
jgi:hypothetical protein